MIQGAVPIGLSFGTLPIYLHLDSRFYHILSTHVDFVVVDSNERLISFPLNVFILQDK